MLMLLRIYLLLLLCVSLIMTGCTRVGTQELAEISEATNHSQQESHGENADVSSSSNEESWKLYGLANSHTYIPSVIHTTDDGIILEYRNIKSGSLYCSFSNARFIDNLDNLPVSGNQYFRGGQSLYFINDGKTTKVDVDDSYFSNQDGMLYDGCYLLLVDVTITSNNATEWISSEMHTHSDGAKVPAGDYTDPYLFRIDAIVSLSDTSIPTINNDGAVKPDSYYTRSINYFSIMGKEEENPILFRVEPGDEISFTIGFLVGDNRRGGQNDLSSLVLSDYDGGFEGDFIDLNLEAP